MRMPLLSRIIFYFMGLYLPIGAHIADYSQTHIFNPNWPPHAKFHTGQTLMFSIFLGVLTIYFASRKTNDKTYGVSAVAVFASLYWITQALAIFYPGTGFLDPQFETASRHAFSIPPQLIVDAFGLALTAIAVVAATKKNARWVI